MQDSKKIYQPEVFTTDFGLNVLYYFRKKIPFFPLALCSPETASLCFTPNEFSPTTMNDLYSFLLFFQKISKIYGKQKHENQEIARLLYF